MEAVHVGVRGQDTVKVYEMVPLIVILRNEVDFVSSSFRDVFKGIPVIVN